MDRLKQLLNELRLRLPADQFEWALPLAVLLGVLVVGYIIKKIAVALLRRWAARSDGPVSHLVIQAVNGPLTFWVLLLAIYLAARSAQLTPGARELVGRSLLVLFVMSLTLVAARMSGDLVKHFGSRMPGGMQVTSLTQNLATGIIFTLGVTILLNLFGISITPILTALGVGGLAVALALQDTLSNLFAGFYVGLARQIRIGDYIRLNSGEEGFVVDIGWRATMVRMLANNMIIIPNGKLAQAIVTNYDLPDKKLGISLSVGVGYDSDPEEVERVLLDVARSSAADLPVLLAEPEPSARFNGFGDSALNFGLNIHVAQFTDQYLILHELRKRILKQFRAAGIDMPFPTRTLFLHGQANPGRQNEEQPT